MREAKEAVQHGLNAVSFIPVYHKWVGHLTQGTLYGMNMGEYVAHEADYECKSKIGTEKRALRENIFLRLERRSVVETVSSIRVKALWCQQTRITTYNIAEAM